MIGLLLTIIVCAAVAGFADEIATWLPRRPRTDP